MPDNLKLGIKGFKKVCIKAKNIPIQGENLLLSYEKVGVSTLTR